MVAGDRGGKPEIAQADAGGLEILEGQRHRGAHFIGVEDVAGGVAFEADGCGRSLFRDGVLESGVPENVPIAFGLYGAEDEGANVSHLRLLRLHRCGAERETGLHWCIGVRGA